MVEGRTEVFTPSPRETKHKQLHPRFQLKVSIPFFTAITYAKHALIITSKLAIRFKLENSLPLESLAEYIRYSTK